MGAGPTGLIPVDADDDAVVLGGDRAAERPADISHLPSPDELPRDGASELTGACHLRQSPFLFRVRGKRFLRCVHYII